MTAIWAAELPDGSVVANKATAWLKNNPSEWSQWSGTNGGYFSNGHVQDQLDDGAQVLREGLT